MIKTNCIESDIFDARLKNIVISMIDVSYGQDNGLNQAI
jgi:peptide subunit release factor 1 (eRF1)